MNNPTYGHNDMTVNYHMQRIKQSLSTAWAEIDNLHGILCPPVLGDLAELERQQKQNPPTHESTLQSLVMKCDEIMRSMGGLAKEMGLLQHRMDKLERKGVDDDKQQDGGDSAAKSETA